MRIDKKIILKAAAWAVMVFPAWWQMVGTAAEPKTLENEWTWNQDYSKFTGGQRFNDNTAVASSTRVISGVGFSYAILAKGTSVQFTIQHTTRTYADTTITVTSKTTNVQWVIDNVPLNGKFPAMTYDPTFVFHALDSAATVHLYVDYGERKVR